MKGKAAFLDGECIDESSAMIGAMSNAALYGRGVFTTVRISGGEPFLLDKHVRRLRENAVAIGLDDSDDSFADLGSNIRELLDANKLIRGRARITLFDKTSSSLWTSSRDGGVSVLILTADQQPTLREFRLTISPYNVNSRSPLVGVKSCNYLENLVAHSNAKERGFDEAIRLNESGAVASGCMSNVFWLKDGKLFTPRLETGCLAGTTRQFILENIACSETIATIEDIQNAGSIFLTSAGIGVRQAAALDDRQFEAIDHEILHLIPE
jgi:branched-chain amino acid aminotransferase